MSLLEGFEFEDDDDAPKAGMVELCLEDCLDEITATAHTISRAMGVTPVPRIYTYTSKDGRKWECEGVDVGIVELMPKGLATLKERLRAPYKDAAHTVHIWVMILPSESPEQDRPSGRYLMFAGSTDGALRHMVFSGSGWRTPSGQGELFDQLQSRMETSRKSPQSGEGLGMVEGARVMMQEAGSIPEGVAETVIEVICALHARYLRALVVQAENLVGLIERDVTKGSREKVETLERNLRAVESAKVALQKDFDKVQGMNQSLVEQRNRSEEALRTLRATVPRVSSRLAEMSQKTLNERLDLLF